MDTLYNFRSIVSRLIIDLFLFNNMILCYKYVIIIWVQLSCGQLFSTSKSCESHICYITKCFLKTRVHKQNNILENVKRPPWVCSNIQCVFVTWCSLYMCVLTKYMKHRCNVWKPVFLLLFYDTTLKYNIWHFIFVK